MDPITDITISIPVSDAEIIRAALNSSLYHNTVLDLAEQYRKLSQRPQPSKLTQALKNSLTLLTAYIELGDPEDGPDES